VSETLNEPSYYQVSYTEFVRIELSKLLAKAEERGLGSQVREAVEKINYNLRVYPQFGEPLRDLSMKSAQLWVGFVGPLKVHYAIYEEQRLVIVSVPIEPLRHSGL
jgi:hypothetical protein